MKHVAIFLAGLLLFVAISGSAAQTGFYSWQMWGATPGHVTALVMGPGAMSRMFPITLDARGLIERRTMLDHMAVVFGIMDAERRGSVSREEYLAVRTATGEMLDQPALDDIQQARLQRFADLDADHDGALSWPEFRAGAERLFDAADRNRLGALTPAQYRVIDWQ